MTVVQHKVVIFHHNETLIPFFFQFYYNVVKLFCIQVPFRTTQILTSSPDKGLPSTDRRATTSSLPFLSSSCLFLNRSSTNVFFNTSETMSRDVCPRLHDPSRYLSSCWSLYCSSHSVQVVLLLSVTLCSHTHLYCCV